MDIGGMAGTITVSDLYKKYKVRGKKYHKLVRVLIQLGYVERTQIKKRYKLLKPLPKRAYQILEEYAQKFLLVSPPELIENVSTLLSYYGHESLANGLNLIDRTGWPDDPVRVIQLYNPYVHSSRESASLGRRNMYLNLAAYLFNLEAHVPPGDAAVLHQTCGAILAIAQNTSSKAPL